MHAFASRVRSLIVLLPILFLASACDSIFGPGDDPATIEISASRTTLELLGDTVMLTAVVRDGGGSVVSGATVEWQSAAGAVATVAGSGLVTARGNGNAWVVASSGQARDSIRLTVSSPIDCAPVGDLLLPDTTTGTLSSSDCLVDLNGDLRVDAWRFQVPAETQLSIELKSVDFDAMLLLLDHNGVEIAFNDDNGTSLDSRITMVLPEGLYYIYATSYGGPGTGSYELSAIEGVPPSPCPATAAVSFPDTVTGTVDAGSCLFNDYYIDVWRLELDTAADIVVQVGSDDFGPAVVVADTLGSFLGSSGGYGGTAMLEISLQPGSYDIWLGAGYESRRSGSYTLSVVPGPATLTCAAAGTISVPGTVSGELTTEDCFLYVSHADAWELELGETTTLALSLASDHFVPLILISDSLGEIFDYFFAGQASVLAETTLDAGRYRIWAVADDGGRGSYTLGVSQPGQLPECEASASLVSGDTVSGALETSDCQLPDGRYADVWTTTVDTTSVLRVTLSSAKFDAYLQVADSTGAVIARDDDGGGNGNAALTLELAPGLYQLWAMSYAPDEIGAYTLALDDAPAESSAATELVPGEAPGVKDRDGSLPSVWPHLQKQHPWTEGGGMVSASRGSGKGGLEIDP